MQSLQQASARCAHTAHSTGLLLRGQGSSTFSRYYHPMPKRSWLGLDICMKFPAAQGRRPCLAKQLSSRPVGGFWGVLCPLLGAVLKGVGPGADFGPCWWLQPPGRLPLTAFHLCFHGCGKPFKLHWPALPVTWAVPAGPYLTWELSRCIFMEMSSRVNSPWPGF